MGWKPATHELRRVAHPAGGKMMTKQAFRDDVDINLIVKRYGQNGMFDHLERREATYGDFSRSTNLHEAMNLVKAAEAEFEELPAEVRTLANNDPVQYYAMLAEEKETQALKRAGMPIDIPDGPDPVVPEPPGDLPRTPESSAPGEGNPTG